MNENQLYINGPQKLQGELLVQGSKNAALPMLAAMVLASGVFILHHCPKISDVEYMLELLEKVGCDVQWEGHMLLVDTRHLENEKIISQGAGKMRSSIALLGSMLGRLHQVEVSYPGGCTIGKRPIDLHLKALKQLGVVFEDRKETLFARADKLHGASIYLDFPSVGATENIMLAAVLSTGTTKIHGAAMEPEIVELATFLKKMGAKIKGEGSSVICIEGVECLCAIEHIVPADRIVAGTYLFGSVLTRGNVRLLHVPVSHLGCVPKLLQDLGATVESQEDWIEVKMNRPCQGIPYLMTAPYPGFPTDLQSVLLAVLTGATSMSFIEEKIFEARFQIVPELQKMGARIECQESFVFLEGGDCLKGAKIEAKELRGGAALIMAALAADGVSCISGMEFVKRGYEDIKGDLKKLGIVLYSDVKKGMNK